MSNYSKAQIEQLNALRKSILNAVHNNLPGKEAHNAYWPESRPKFDAPNAQTIEAAVLILLYYNVNGELCFPLMQRPSYPGHHSGQISLPGGKTEPEDYSLSATALRETAEELGIPAENIEVFAQLTELFIPVSNFMVYPFVGFLKQPVDFKPDPAEVELLIEVTIDELLSSVRSFKKRTFLGKEYDIPYLPLKNEFVWGATSMMLNEFLEVLKISNKQG